MSALTRKTYIESVAGLRLIALCVCACSFARASEPQPATVTAFDRYVMLVEEQNKTRVGPHNFLWIDQHADEKSRAWLSQDVIEPLKMLDHGKEIPVPDGLIQDWVGAVFLETATLERVRDVLLGFANYKTVFKQQFSDSRLVKRDGDHFDAFLRIYRRQLESVVLNANFSCDYMLVDPDRAYLICRSTHIGEALHKKKRARCRAFRGRRIWIPLADEHVLAFGIRRQWHLRGTGIDFTFAPAGGTALASVERFRRGLSARVRGELHG